LKWDFCFTPESRHRSAALPIAMSSSATVEWSNGDITCAWSGVIPLNDPPFGARVEKRQSTVRLSRTTGEIKLTLETWGYPGDRVKGNPDISMKLSQSGVCRTIGKALF
jgi:hypothetical protein